MAQLQEENMRLKQLVAELTLDKTMMPMMHLCDGNALCRFKSREIAQQASVAIIAVLESPVSATGFLSSYRKTLPAEASVIKTFIFWCKFNLMGT